MKYVTRILVDPYEIAGKPLQKWVDDLIPDKSFSIQKRYSYRNALYNELASLISKGISSCRDLTQISCVSEELKEWIQGIQGKDLGWQFERFATYLYNGTLVPLLFPSSHFQR